MKRETQLGPHLRAAFDGNRILLHNDDGISAIALTAEDLAQLEAFARAVCHYRPKTDAPYAKPWGFFS